MVLGSFLGVAYCPWPFCAVDLLERAGDETVCCMGVIGISSDECARGRFEGTVDGASSSARGRFSVTLVPMEVDFKLGAEDSGRRATLEASLGLLAVPST